MQKYVGWDSAEKYFLYVMDGQRTHIIHSGIRYFSIFTDASNFGGNMGMASVVFLLVAAYTKNLFLKIFYFLTAGLAIYGLLISGTRSALAVPFVGLAVFVMVCGNPRTVRTPPPSGPVPLPRPQKLPPHFRSYDPAFPVRSEADGNKRNYHI